MQLGLPLAEYIMDIRCAIASVRLWDLRERQLVTRIELHEQPQIHGVAAHIASDRAIFQLSEPLT